MTLSEEEKHPGFVIGVFLFAFVLAAALVAANGFAASLAWNRWLVPFGAQPLGVGMAVLVVAMLRALVSNPSASKRPDQPHTDFLAEACGRAIARTLTIYLILGALALLA